MPHREPPAAAEGASVELPNEAEPAASLAWPLAPIPEAPLGPAGLDVRAVWQLSSMSVGAGVFAIPIVFVQLGLAQAVLWVAIMGGLADFAMQRLLDVAGDEGLDSYEALAERAFGGAGKVVMGLMALVTTFIAALSYVGAAKELLLSLAVAFLLDLDVNTVPAGVEVLSEARDVVLLAVMVAAVLPLCLSPTMGGNGWISKYGVFCMLAAALFFIGRCAAVLACGCGPGLRCGSRPRAVDGSLLDALELIATLAFSFSMIFALFPVLQERIGVSPVAYAVPGMKRAVRCSVVLCCALYMAIGLSGSLAFGSATKAISLSNLPLLEPLTKLITFMVGMSVEMLVAIVAFPTVQSLEMLLGLCGRSRCGGQRRPWLVGALGIAMVFADAFLPTKTAFTLCGALGLSISAYVMPCVLFLRLADASRGHASHVRPWTRVLAYVVLCFGLVLLLGSTPVTLARLASRAEGPRPQALVPLLCHEGGAPRAVEA